MTMQNLSALIRALYQALQISVSMGKCICIRSIQKTCQLSLCGEQAVLNPKTSILIETRHSYTQNLNSATPGDRINAFQQCGDVS